MTPIEERAQFYFDELRKIRVMMDLLPVRPSIIDDLNRTIKALNQALGQDHALTLEKKGILPHSVLITITSALHHMQLECAVDENGEEMYMRSLVEFVNSFQSSPAVHAEFAEKYALFDPLLLYVIVQSYGRQYLAYCSNKEKEMRKGCDVYFSSISNIARSAYEARRNRTDRVSLLLRYHYGRIAYNPDLRSHMPSLLYREQLLQLSKQNFLDYSQAAEPSDELYFTHQAIKYYMAPVLEHEDSEPDDQIDRLLGLPVIEMFDCTDFTVLMKRFEASSEKAHGFAFVSRGHLTSFRCGDRAIARYYILLDGVISTADKVIGVIDGDALMSSERVEDPRWGKFKKVL